MTVDQPPTPPMDAIAREWLAARIVFVVGFVLAIVFAGVWTYIHRPSAQDELGASDSLASGQVGSGKTSQAGFMLCRLAIANAENFGVLPGNMKFAGGPQKTSVQGRYACAADDAKGVRYVITIDFVCKDFNNQYCVNMYSLTKADGSPVYQRHLLPGDPGVSADAGTDQSGAAAPAAGAPADSAAQPPPAADGGGDSSGTAPTDNSTQQPAPDPGAPQQQP